LSGAANSISAQISSRLKISLLNVSKPFLTLVQKAKLHVCKNKMTKIRKEWCKSFYESIATQIFVLILAMDPGLKETANPNMTST
jgi:hypothetical protein